MIHRAIFGSLERFIAILTEHLGGKWPLWLSPRQVSVCAVSEASHEYCKTVSQQLRQLGFEVELDISQSTLPKKIRNAQVMQFNYILVAGNEETELGVVEVRNARLGDKGRLGKMTVEEFAGLMKSEYPEGVSLPKHIKL